MFSTSPAPKSGVGRQKIIFSFASAWAKLGCCMAQLPASARPETLKRSSTPPLGALVLGVPSELAKNGKRASRVGPCAVMNVGIVLLDVTMLLAIAWNCGLFAGPVPPTAG